MLIVAGPAALVSPARGAADNGWAALRDADLRLAAIGERLAVANAALCVRHQAFVGLVPIALSAFPAPLRPTAAAAYGLSSSSGVEAVVPGSPAAAAGIMPGDQLLAIDGKDIMQPGAVQAANTRDQNDLADAIAALAPGQAATIEVGRGSRRHKIELMPLSGCPARFEVELRGTKLADSDGRLIRIGSAFMDELDDDRLAAVVAHEMAHGVLGHRFRLDQAHIGRGLLSAFGRNASAIRQTEQEADQLSVFLLSNAGYDVRAPALFWRTFGRKIDGGPIRSPTHFSAAQRAALLDSVAAGLPSDRNKLCPIIAPGCAEVK